MKKAKISERLSESQVVELVKIYKEYDCLWDVSNANYKNRKVRDHAYKEILMKLKIPGLKVADIPQKIKNLRSSYYTELKKMENSTRGGRKMYKPKVAWFSIADEILRTRSQNVETTETESEAESSDGKAKKDDTEQTTTQSINSAYRTPLLDIGLSQAASQRSILRLPHPVRSSHLFKVVGPSSRGASHTTCADTQSPLHSKQPPVETTTIVDNMTNEATVSQTTSTLREPETKYEEDEFDVYGEYIALSLRPMPEEYSILARVELQKTIAKIQLMASNKEKRDINPEQCGPSTSKMEENPLRDLPDDIVEMEEDSYTLTVKIEEEYE